ncbi:DMT family transporter [Vibrio methylphosphonaticus]|uniref:DMT family transporter n=1 Tax=Vibrio methylphosphonaticus TaxID=2946866 RepID=UPI00202A40C1|nr:EamA family transporter [Vibrio methylphosphonaticus]MCL9774171.1 EamA family transporter [Vibrio methylphosphonaticus]
MNSNYLLAITTMTAFALNSLFARFALGFQAIDPMSYTLIRLLSGALALILLALLSFRSTRDSASPSLGFLPSCTLGASLLGYAILFSLAYDRLDTGVGALILFGTVQLTLIGYHRLSGHAISKMEMLGIGLSLVGFVTLMQPSQQQPDFSAAFLMSLAGISWAIFTILGKQSKHALIATKQGFIFGAGMMTVLYLGYALYLNDAIVTTTSLYLTPQGVGLALLSGIGASAIGYYLWYLLLPKIDLLQASLLQLTVPVIALALGMVFIGEQITVYSCIATLLILGGIALASFSKVRLL